MIKSIKSFIILTAIAGAMISCNRAQNGNTSNFTPAEKIETFSNPLLGGGADPWALWHEGNYYYMNTTGGKLVLWVTPDITDLKNAEKEIIWEPADPKVSKHIWAPEIHYIDGKWYVYFSADDGNTDNHQVYVLENTSANPLEGEFKMKGRISTDKDNNWAIDASVFEHRGKLYMVWSGWQTRRIDTETQCIYIASMKNPWTLDSDRVLLSKPEYDWERLYINEDGSHPKHIIYVNEGPQPLVSPNGKLVHIIYSASGCWTPHYCLGRLTAKANSDLLDPASWSKAMEPQFKQSPENKVYGPGHNSFFKSPDGKEDYILYHARNSENSKASRSPRIQKIGWDRKGYPVFGTPLPTATPLPKPSGTK